VSVAERMKFETVSADVVPFLFADLVRLVLLASFPIISLFLPRLMIG
jgi:TRAP-type C4-dicarboxylate transport system permease large subunit